MASGATGRPFSELPSLKLVCLGAPSVLVNGEHASADVLWRKNVALLAYLALSPEYCRTRDHLLGLLWPEKSEDRARHSLNEAIRRLRGGLGAERIISRGDAVTLNDERLEVDALSAFDATPSEVASPGMIGEFLEGLYLDNAPEFERWVDSQRRRLASKATAFLLHRGEQALATSPQSARETAQQVLSNSPTCEPALDLLMRASTLLGDSTAALAAFKEFEARLNELFQEKPSRRLASLAERVRSGSWRGAVPSAREQDPQLVGRRETNAAAFATVSQGISGSARCLVVTAEHGMGRSRLASECARRAALDGALTLTARPLESDSDARWSVIGALVRNGLAEAPGLAGTDPGSLAVMASVAPALAERFKPSEPADHAHVSASFTALIHAVTEEVPIVMIVDDAHYSDGASLGALSSMMLNVRNRPVVLIVTSLESPQDCPRELLKLQGEVGRGIPGTAVHLDPLDNEEVGALVASWEALGAEGEDHDRLVRRISYEAGGSPFLTVELLRGFERAATLRNDAMTWPPPHATLESPLPFSVPALVCRSISARIIDLDEESRRVLCAASVGGVALDLELIENLVNLPADRVEEAVATLERYDFVQFDGLRYTFAAPLISDVVTYGCMTRGEKQRLRRHASELLRSRTDLESRVLRTELLSSVGPGREAYEDAISVAEEALASGSVRTAKRALVAAERSADASDGPDREKIVALRSRIPK